MNGVLHSLTWSVRRWVAGHRRRRPAGPPASARPRLPMPVKGIRRRRDRDLGACARLLRVVFSEGQYPLSWPDAPRAWLAAEDVLGAWVVERHGELLGHVAISAVGTDPVSSLRWREVTGRSPSELAGVSRFFVRSRVRGRGLGTALLDVAVAEIRRRGRVPVVEVVSASTDAIRLYEGLGWRQVAMYHWGTRSDDLRVYYYTAPPEAGRGFPSRRPG